MLVVMNYLVLTKWSSFLTCQIIGAWSNIVNKIFFSLVIDIEVRCFQNFHTWFFCLFLLKYSVLILFLLLHFFVSFFFVVFILFRSCEFVSVSILETNWLFLLFLSVLRLISRVVFMVDRGISYMLVLSLNRFGIKGKVSSLNISFFLILDNRVDVVVVLSWVLFWMRLLPFLLPQVKYTFAGFVFLSQLCLVDIIEDSSVISGSWGFSMNVCCFGQRGRLDSFWCFSWDFLIGSYLFNDFRFFFEFVEERLKDYFLCPEFNISWVKKDKCFDGSFVEFCHFVLDQFVSLLHLLYCTLHTVVVVIDKFDHFLPIFLHLPLLLSQNFTVLSEKVIDLSDSPSVGFWEGDELGLLVFALMLLSVDGLALLAKGERALFWVDAEVLWEQKWVIWCSGWKWHLWMIFIIQI